MDMHGEYPQGVHYKQIGHEVLTFITFYCLK